MKRIFSIMLSIMIAFSFNLVGCSNENIETKVLRVCNCEDYIDEDLLAEFTEETGIEVEYSTYGTNENLYNELVINPNSYDLVVPSEYMIEKLALEGRIQPLDFSKISGYENNLSPFIKERLNGLKVKDGEYKDRSLYDFMVGYMWGTMGWVYNTEHVTKEEVSSWDGVFNNPNLKGQITIKDAVRDSYIVGLAMVYKDQLTEETDNLSITEILNRTDKVSIDAVGEKLNSIKPMLYGFEVDSGKNDIVLGNINAYVAWSGDAAYAIDVASGEVEDDDGTFVENTRDLSYSIPEEGSNIWFDGFVMPKGSDNHDAVYKFLEFISRPESVYRNMDYTGYTGMLANGEFTLEDEETGEEYQTNLFNEVVVGWFDESEDLEDGEGKLVDFSYFFGDEGDYSIIVSEEGYGRLLAQYPTKEIVERCAIMGNYDSNTLMDINDMWESVKGETFSLWFIIVIACLVVLMFSVILIYRNKEKFPWLKLPERKTRKIKKGYKIVKIEEVEL